MAHDSAARGPAEAFRDRLLDNWGVAAADRRVFLSPTLEDLLAAPLPPGGEACVARLGQAADQGEEVVLFGDSDIDGCMGVAVLEAALRKRGASVSHAFDQGSPHEGPGLRLGPLEPALAARATLVVTVDSAVRHPGVAEALAERGVEVWVTDHHPPPPGPLDRTVNPLLPGAAFASLCGAGVALRLALALDAEEPGASNALAAALLATLGDAVPLVGENRTIALLGLAAWRRTELPAFAALRRPAKDTIESEIWALRRDAVAPLNAGPRYGDAESSVGAFLADDPKAAMACVARLEAANRRRRREMRAILGKVPQPKVGPPGAVAAILAPLVPPTHVSLVAGRLVHELGRPVVVFGASAEGRVRGSARSPDGYPLRDEAARVLGDIALDLGGHALAFGLTIPAARSDEAAALLATLRLPPAPPQRGAVSAGETTPSAALQVVESLGPYGPGFSRPAVSWEGSEVEVRGPGEPVVVAGERVAVDAPAGIEAGKRLVARLHSRRGAPLLRIISGA